MYGMIPRREDGQPPEVAAREEVDHAEERALHLVEELRRARGRRSRGWARGRPSAIRDEQDDGHDDAALQLRDLEDVLKALEAFDHEAGTSVPSVSTRPPFASIFARADSLTAWARTVSACATSPVAQDLDRATRSLSLIRPSADEAVGIDDGVAPRSRRATRGSRRRRSVLRRRKGRTRASAGGGRAASGRPRSRRPCRRPTGRLWPLCPLVEVFPWPEPGPRPIFLRRFVAPGARRSSSSFTGHLEHVQHLGDHAAHRRRIRHDSPTGGCGGAPAPVPSPPASGRGRSCERVSVT